jgi:hypothetical protein
MYNVLRTKDGHTHYNAIYFRLLGFVIILFQGPFTDGKGSVDSKGEVR